LLTAVSPQNTFVIGHTSHPLDGVLNTVQNKRQRYEHGSDWGPVNIRWGDRVARRSAILAAAGSLLREQGLSALQMREVARRAGIALGTVYTYFPTKEGLYAAMYAERLDELLNELEPKLASITDLEELFVVIATSYRDVYAEFGKELDILAVVGGRSNLDPVIRDQLVASAGRVLAAVRSILERAGEKDVYARAADPDLVIALLWSTVTGLADHFTGIRHEMHRHTWDDTVRFAAHVLVRGLVEQPVSQRRSGHHQQVDVEGKSESRGERWYK
jgi:AcrR family transcriptional regulator